MSDRYKREWNSKESAKRLFEYMRTSEKVEKGVVFDIGTRAIRVVCGPKSLPEKNWQADLFFNDRALTYLGENVSLQRTLSTSCAGLQTVIDFIVFYTSIFEQVGIPLQSCMAFGTAVFRWLQNKEEVANFLNQQTSLDFRILSEQNEALYAMRGVQATFKMRSGQEKEDFGKQDVLLLFDQGGGSLEVSYSYVNDFSKNGFFSFDDLGTIALKRRFFSMYNHDHSIHPTKNANLVSTQCKTTQKYIQQRILQWEGYPQLQGKSIHAYAIGSAVKRLVSRSAYDTHNTVLNQQIFINKIAENDWSQQQKNQPASALYEDIQQDQSGNLYDTQFLLRYGLTAYTELLKKFNVQSLRVCGYGLRYGVFAAIHKWDDIPSCLLHTK